MDISRDRKASPDVLGHFYFHCCRAVYPFLNDGRSLDHLSRKYVKPTILIKKKLVREMKQAVLDSDTTVIDLADKAFYDFLAKRKAK